MERQVGICLVYAQVVYAQAQADDPAAQKRMERIKKAQELLVMKAEAKQQKQMVKQPANQPNQANTSKPSASKEDTEATHARIF